MSIEVTKKCKQILGVGILNVDLWILNVILDNICLEYNEEKYNSY